MSKNIFQEKADYGFRKTFENDAARDAYLQELAKRNRETLGLANRSRPNYPRLMGIAASIAVLLIAGFYFSQSNELLEEKDLFDTYYTPLAYAGEGITRGTSDQGSSTTPVSAAISAYQKEDYQEAATLFEAYLKEQPDDLEHWLYLGLSELPQNPAKAEKTLQRVIDQSSDYALKETAIWYRSLALVKAKRQTEACQLMASYTGEMSDFMARKQSDFLQACEQ